MLDFGKVSQVLTSPIFVGYFQYKRILIIFGFFQIAINLENLDWTDSYHLFQILIIENLCYFNK